jgi:anthranilate synthase
MGIQHKTLPFAAVQFHPESILTSPAHGLTILKNALSYLCFGEDRSVDVASGAEIVGSLEKLPVNELKSRLKAKNISTTGTKSELVVRLALWEHKSTEAKAGRIPFNEMSDEELVELKQGLGLKGAFADKPELVRIIEASLLETTKLY